MHMLGDQGKALPCAGGLQTYVLVSSYWTGLQNLGPQLCFVLCSGEAMFVTGALPCWSSAHGVHSHVDWENGNMACEGSTGILTLLEWITGFGQSLRPGAYGTVRSCGRVAITAHGLNI